MNADENVKTIKEFVSLGFAVDLSFLVSLLVRIFWTLGCSREKSLVSMGSQPSHAFKFRTHIPFSS